MQTEMLIGGAFAKGDGEAEKILNPKTGEVILALPEASAEQVDEAVAAAANAFLKWSRTAPMERSLLLLKLADRIEAEADDFAALEALNCGKPKHAILRDETPTIVDLFPSSPAPAG